MNPDYLIPEDILEAFIEDMKKKGSLKVLIFGPGSSGGDVYVKRKEIRDQIRVLGHNTHDAYFGEELCNPKKLAANGFKFDSCRILNG